MKNRLLGYYGICFLLTCLIVCIFPKNAPCEEKESEAEKPPSHNGRIVGELLAGGTGGVAVVIAGMQLGALIGSVVGDRDKGAYIGFIIGSIGYPLGNAMGVYLVGNLGNETGSFSATLKGSILGTLVGALVGGAGCLFATADSEVDPIFITIYTTSELMPIALVGGGLVGAPIGASIGATLKFNKTRRYKSPPASEGRISPAAPIIYFDLVKVRF